MSGELTVAVKNDLLEVERLSGLVEEFGARHAIPPRVVFEMNLALDEVLTNVISYAYDDTSAHDIVVRISLQAAELVLQVEDDGRPFNPLEVAAPALNQPLEERPLGGLGVFLVRRVMDHLEYRRQRGRNILVMRKSLAQGERATEMSDVDPIVDGRSEGAAQMEILETKRNDVVILGVSGRLDASTAPSFEAKILGLIAGGDRRFVVDCAPLDYISSAGLRVLLVAAKRLNANGGTIVLASLKGQIKEVLDIAGFSSIFHIYGTQDEALAALRAA